MHISAHIQVQSKQAFKQDLYNRIGRKSESEAKGGRECNAGFVESFSVIYY